MLTKYLADPDEVKKGEWVKGAPTRTPYVVKQNIQVQLEGFDSEKKSADGRTGSEAEHVEEITFLGTKISSAKFKQDFEDREKRIYGTDYESASKNSSWFPTLYGEVGYSSEYTDILAKSRNLLGIQS